MDWNVSFTSLVETDLGWKGEGWKREKEKGERRSLGEVESGRGRQCQSERKGEREERNLERESKHVPLRERGMRTSVSSARPPGTSPVVSTQALLLLRGLEQDGRDPHRIGRDLGEVRTRSFFFFEP